MSLYYKIQYYRNMKDEPVATYYREFDSKKEMKLWAIDTLSNDSLYTRYTYLEITIDQYLKNI